MSLLKLIHKALSDSDIRKILGHSTKIIKYSELSQFTDLDDLLPNPTDYCIILYEDSIDHGHWVGLCRYDGKYEHFDSYGLKPDKELAWVNFKVRRSLGETQPFLSELLKQKEYIYNTVKYQASEADVNTCGSHVVHRLYRLKNQHMDLDDYHNFMQGLEDDFNMTYDMIVAEFIHKFF